MKFTQADLNTLLEIPVNEYLKKQQRINIRIFKKSTHSLQYQMRCLIPPIS